MEYELTIKLMGDLKGCPVCVENQYFNKTGHEHWQQVTRK